MNASLATKSICFVGVALTFITVLSIGNASADVYMYKDKDGKLTFTNVPCSQEQTKQGCKYILLEKGNIIPDRQWAWREDINYDGKVTISDIPGWFQWLFYYPGDLIVYAMLKGKDKKTAEFFEITPASYGGTGSLLISLVAWFVAWGAWLAAVEVVVEWWNEFAGFYNKMEATTSTLWHWLGRWLRAKARALRKH